jgi:hypothetical protein
VEVETATFNLGVWVVGAASSAKPVVEAPSATTIGATTGVWAQAVAGASSARHAPNRTAHAAGDRQNFADCLCRIALIIALSY